MTQTSRTITHRATWAAQVLLSLLFVFAGTMKFVTPIERMQDPVALPAAFLYFIGAAEMLGGLGLILPGLLRIRPELTTAAAIGLLTIMSGATTLSVVSLGAAAGLVPFVVGLLVAAVAWSRGAVVPLAPRVAR